MAAFFFIRYSQEYVVCSSSWFFVKNRVLMVSEERHAIFLVIILFLL